MRQLKKSECAILPLVLKKKWYDLIDSGEKKEEYREDKPYWDVRIGNWLNKAQSKNLAPVVAFSLGYRPATMFFKVPEYPVMQSDEANHPEWGETAVPHYVIELGERVEIVDAPLAK